MVLTYQSIIPVFLIIGYVSLVQGDIDVPNGNILIKNVHGIGTQDYKCVKGKFQFIDESAELFQPDNSKDREGTYNLNGKTDGNGGRVEFIVDGSKAIFKLSGRDISEVAKNTPDLRYTATSTSNGLLQSCTFVQRRNTIGGVAPTRTCKDGEIVKAKYEADYAFFAKGKQGSTTPGASPGNDPGPIVPKSLKGIDVPNNNVEFKRVKGIGMQIYGCIKGKYEFKEASADLFQPNDRSDKEGVHFFNPQPDASGGRAVFVLRDSKAVFKKIGEKDFKNVKNIPEVLLAATSTTPGTLGEVTFVQRLNPVGGAAPVGKCTDGKIEKVPYQTDYVFFRAKGTRKQKRSIGRFIPRV